MSTLQARVSDALARAARSRAEQLHRPLSQYLIDLVETDLARAAEEQAWERFAEYYAHPARVRAAQAESETYAATLSDGLTIEDWDHLA